MEKAKALKGVVIGALILITLAVAVLFATDCVVRKIIYPLGYRETVEQYAREYGLAPALVFSVIKVESGYNEKAVSGKGAKGLMQITESTGRYIAKKLGEQNYDLLDASTNIRFGCYYINYLIERFGEVSTALYAYNAGEGRVSGWLRDNRYSFDGKTLHFVPYAETREYTEKIFQTLSK